MDPPPDSQLDKDWWHVEARSTPQTRCRDFKPFLIHSGCVSGCVILLRGTAAIREYRFCERVSMVATALIFLILLYYIILLLLDLAPWF